MNKTAMQLLFEKYGHLLPNIEKEFIELEKQQVKNGYNQGYREGIEDIPVNSSKDVSFYENANIYYTQTFKKDTNG